MLADDYVVDSDTVTLVEPPSVTSDQSTIHMEQVIIDHQTTVESEVSGHSYSALVMHIAGHYVYSYVGVTIEDSCTFCDSITIAVSLLQYYYDSFITIAIGGASGR